MIKYKFDVLQWLKAAGYNTGRLRREKLLGQSTLQKLRHGDLLSWGELSKVCELLHVQPGDVVYYVPDSAEGARVPGPSEYAAGVDVIAAAVGVPGHVIVDGITRSRMSVITISDVVHMTAAQVKTMGQYLLSFVEPYERPYKAEEHGAEDISREDGGTA